MKNILKIACVIVAIYCIYFPFSYFHSTLDKKAIKISHILVNTEDKATELKSRIENGESFEELAKAYSECPSGEDGGDIGFNERGKILPEIEKIAFTEKFNNLIGPVETEVGWHILKLTDVQYFSDKENFSRKYYVDVKEELNKLK